MFNRIRQLFSKTEIALSPASRDFITKLAGSEIWILVVGIRGTPALPSIADPAIFDVIAEHRIDVSEIGDDDSVFPFNYERDGRHIFPFFSSKDRASHFIVNSDFDCDLSLFQPFCMLPGFVAAPENDMFDLILDPRSEAERRIGRDERLLIRTLSQPSA